MRDEVPSRCDGRRIRSTVGRGSGVKNNVTLRLSSYSIAPEQHLAVYHIQQAHGITAPVPPPPILPLSLFVIDLRHPSRRGVYLGSELL